MCLEFRNASPLCLLGSSRHSDVSLPNVSNVRQAPYISDELGIVFGQVAPLFQRSYLLVQIAMSLNRFVAVYWPLVYEKVSFFLTAIPRYSPGTAC